MCGIIGYTGTQEAAPILLDGLTRLEYRGYDSAGIAVMGADGSLTVGKAQGKLSVLNATLANGLPEGTVGIGHTRWATHGQVTDSNAHPHTDCGNSVAVVHNGIVENYLELREELEVAGHVFSSQTDSECIPHLVETFLRAGMSLEDAARATARRVKGAHAVAVATSGEPGKLVAFKLTSETSDDELIKKAGAPLEYADLVVANSADAMEAEAARVVLVSRDAAAEGVSGSKQALADAILDRVAS